MQIKTITTQKVLSPTQISLADYVINPYKGCEFGCLYCYAQENKNIDKNIFFESLSVKINAPEILERELKYKKPKRVLLGSTTECFPAEEKKFKVTEKILKILNAKNISYTILTKSHLISDYLELIMQNPKNKIFFTLNFQSDKLIRLFEQKSSSLNQRLETIGKIITAKINLRIHIGPFIPYICDLEKILKLLSEGVKEIDIELYHKKQGNFSQIIEVVIKKTLVFAGIFAMAMLVVALVSTITKVYVGKYIAISDNVSTLISVLVAISLYAPIYLVSRLNVFI